jgi:hypothetical protein
VFGPFSLPETPLHRVHVAEGRIFDPSYLCIGNDLLSMRIAGLPSPREYYRRLIAINDALYRGRGERMRDWIAANPRLSPERRAAMLAIVARQQREEPRVDRWWGHMQEAAPDEYRPFAAEAIGSWVPGFDRYALALD